MRVEIVEVPVEAIVKLPEELTSACEMPLLPPISDNGITYGDVVSYSVGLQGTVEECNRKLESIRALQETE